MVMHLLFAYDTIIADLEWLGKQESMLRPNAGIPPVNSQSPDWFRSTMLF